jgi:predicted metal-dependent hydrolase
MDETDNDEIGPSSPFENGPDVAHISKQIRFAQTSLEFAEQEYKNGNIAAADRALETAQSAISEARRSLADVADQHRTLLLELKVVEAACSRLVQQRQQS